MAHQHEKDDFEMTKYGEEYILTQEDLDEIASYMNDEIRESLAGDTNDPTEFLQWYVKKDPDFVDLLRSEFHIELWYLD